MTKSGIKQLISVLNKSIGIVVDKSTMLEALPELRYVPNSCVDGMCTSASKVNSKKRDLDTIIAQWRKDGSLTFEPYVMRNSAGDNVYCLSCNKFLCLFRGEEWAVTSSPDSGTVARSEININSLLTTKQRSELTDMTLYLSLAELGMQVPEIRKIKDPLLKVVHNLLPAGVRWNPNDMFDWEQHMQNDYIYCGEWAEMTDGLRDVLCHFTVMSEEQPQILVVVTRTEINMDVGGDKTNIPCILRLPDGIWSNDPVQSAEFIFTGIRYMLERAGVYQSDDDSEFFVESDRTVIYGAEAGVVKNYRQIRELLTKACPCGK